MPQNFRIISVKYPSYHNDSILKWFAGSTLFHYPCLSKARDLRYCEILMEFVSKCQINRTSAKILNRNRHTMKTLSNKSDIKTVIEALKQ